MFLIGRIAQKLAGSTFLAALAAFTLAVAVPAVMVSTEVRSYMLCVFFVMWSFLHYLDLVKAAPPPSLRARLLFAGPLVLAMASDYCAVFYVLACLTAPLLLATLEPAYRRTLVAALPARWKADAVTFAAPVAALGFLYLVHARPWTAGRNPSWVGFYHPERETVSSFLLPLLRAEFNLFSPVAVQRLPVVLAIVAALAAAGTWGAVRAHRRRGRDGSALMPLTILALLLAAIVTASLLGRYPFGGALRHQFILFPFAVLSGGLALDEAVHAPPARTTRTLAAFLCFAVVGAVALARWARVPLMREDPFSAPQVDGFRRLFPAPSAVYVDQYSLVRFFSGHHAWRWRAAGSSRGGAMPDHYVVTGEGGGMAVLIDRSRWSFDFREKEMYRDLRRALVSTGTPCTTLFCVKQRLTKVAEVFARPGSFPGRVKALAASEGLDARLVSAEGMGVYASFCLSDPPPPPAP